MEWAMQVCLEDFQDTIAPPRVKMYPLVDFDSSESNNLTNFLKDFSNWSMSNCPQSRISLKGTFLAEMAK